MSLFKRRNQARLYCQRLLSRLPNRRTPGSLSWNKSRENRWRRLDADAQGIEVVARADVAQMLVDEEFLHADEASSRVVPLRGSTCSARTSWVCTRL